MLRIADERHRRRRSGNKTRTTKTGRSRVFPIHPDLVAVLTKMSRSHDGVIFHGPLGGRLKADTARRILVRDVLEKLKERFLTTPGAIGFEDGRLHSPLLLQHCGSGGHCGAHSDALARAFQLENGETLLPSARRRKPKTDEANQFPRGCQQPRGRWRNS
jgi:hypothetical protein